MTLPTFITFTGADDETDIAKMVELSELYPIEWGILFSPTRRGSPRYPSIEWLDKLRAEGPARLSAHLCGGYSRAVLERGVTEVDRSLADRFMRAQINTSDQRANPASITEWAESIGITPIMQCRAGFPEDRRVSWLFDASGGRGIEPSFWPAPPIGSSKTFVGYAGGLRPENVAAHLSHISILARNYWIDMETGVRDEHDRFSIDRCRQVCEAVYGKAAS